MVFFTCDVAVHSLNSNLKYILFFSNSGHLEWSVRVPGVRHNLESRPPKNHHNKNWSNFAQRNIQRIDLFRGKDLRERPFNLKGGVMVFF